MSTGPDNTVDGYLRVCADPFGTLTSDGFCGDSCDGDGTPFSDPLWGDEYNPVGPLGVFEATFSNGMYVFDALNGIRGLLTNIAPLNGMVGFCRYCTVIQFYQGGSHLPFDDNGDGVTDRVVGQAFFTYPGLMRVNLDVEQKVESLSGGVALLTQTYVLTNTWPEPADFVLLKTLDANLYWTDGDPTTDFGNDTVGTGTNGSPLERYVYVQEDGDPTSAITISTTDGDVYYGAKNGIDPDGGGPGPAMGLGTGLELFDAYGVPIGWENFIAGVGADVDGESGPAPAGSIDPAMAMPTSPTCLP